MIPAAVFHGIASCVAILSSVYLLATVCELFEALAYNNVNNTKRYLEKATSITVDGYEILYLFFFLIAIYLHISFIIVVFHNQILIFVPS